MVVSYFAFVMGAKQTVYHLRFCTLLRGSLATGVTTLLPVPVVAKYVDVRFLEITYSLKIETTLLPVTVISKYADTRSRD